MDYFNNEMGRNIAAALLKRNRHTMDRQLMHEVMNYLANKRLRVLKPEFDMSVIRHRA